MTLKMVNGKLLFNYCEHDILKTMYNNEDFCDMAFIVDSTRIPVNRAIISAASSVFKTMLLGSFQEAGSQEIKIPDIGKEGFLHFVKYVYGHGIQMDSIKLKDLLDILALSHQYDLRNLFGALKLYVSTFDLKTIHNIMVSASSSVKLMNAAFTYEIHDLYEKIKVVIQYSSSFVNNFLNDPKFVCLSLPVLSDLLKSDHLKTEEIVILKSVLKWIESNEVTGDSDRLSISDSAYGPTSPKEEMLSSMEIVCRKRKRRNSGAKSSDVNGDFTDEETISQEVKQVGSNDNIGTLLNEIRWSRMRLSEYKKLSAEDPLFQKYKKFLNAIKWSDDYKPRIQLHYKRIRLVCENKITQNDQKAAKNTTVPSYPCKTCLPCDMNFHRFSLAVKYFPNGWDEILVTLSQIKIKCDIDEFPSSAIKYSLILKSFHPLKNNYMLVDRETFALITTGNTEKSSILNATHPFQNIIIYNKPSTTTLGFVSSPAPDYNCIRSYHMVTTTEFCPTLLNSDSVYIENNKFVLEAAIEYID
uniref:BTB/POZ domain-containing protein 6-A n=1 Tax=Cacopsylla melanoneura TaxID=428564 RepID=A0A8D8R8F6_9HEMI